MKRIFHEFFIFPVLFAALPASASTVDVITPHEKLGIVNTSHIPDVQGETSPYFNEYYTRDVMGGSW